MLRPISLFLITSLALVDFMPQTSFQGAGVWSIVLLVAIPTIALSLSVKVQEQRFGVEILTFIILVAWCLNLFLFGWLEVVRHVLGDHFLLVQFGSLLPVLVSLSVLWWLTAPIEQRCSWVSHRLRVDVLLLFIPLFIIWSVRELSTQYVPVDIADEITFVSTLILIINSPTLFRFILSATPMNDVQLAARIKEAGNRAGVHNAVVLVWNTHMRFVNAFAMGVLFQRKRVLFTDKLIEVLTPQELLAVAKHEFAHHRYWHLAFLMLGMFCTFHWLDWIATLLQFDSSFGYVQVLQLLIVIAVYVYLSRIFEQQADAYSVADQSAAQGSSVVTLVGTESLCSALSSIADVNQRPTTQGDLLHGSIQQRQKNMRALIGCEVNQLPIHKKVRWLTFIIVFLFVAGLLT